MSIILNTVEGTDDALACPKCGSEWTHIDVVEVHSADGTALRIEADGEDSHASITATPIPSGDDGRRHTVILTIDCEIGGHSTRLSFKQHKGQTSVTSTQQKVTARD